MLARAPAGTKRWHLWATYEELQVRLMRWTEGGGGQGGMCDMYKELRCCWEAEERGLEGRGRREGRLNERGQAAGYKGNPG